MFYQAEEKDPKCLEYLLQGGKAFLAKYNFPGSREYLKEALELNSRFSDARVVLAENYLTDFQAGSKRFDLAEKNIQAALEVNPHCAEAYRARGNLWLTDGNYPRAIKDLQRAIQENPASLKARGLLAAGHYLSGNDEGFAGQEKAARAINPRGAEFFHTVALALERRFRYSSAVKMCDRALELEPGYWPAYMTLAINCLRTGENARGREFLEKSWENDKFNVWVKNTRKLLEHMDKNHEVHEEPGFVFYFPRRDAGILTAYLVPLLQKARSTFEARYRTHLENSIQIEAFSSHQWFSARTVGLPDFAAAGACFGNVVTLTTPRALPQNWGAVAWHEFAHVIALNLTDNRVPRWFTEGLSVYEEGLDHPSWARNFQRPLADAWASGRLLPMAEIDFGFSKPKFPQQILISYFQGCRIVRLIVKKWGWEKVLQMLRGYREKKGTGKIFQEILGVSLEEFDRQFEDSMKSWVKGNGYRPRLMLEEPEMLALQARAENNREDPLPLADLAWAYLCKGNTVDAALTAAKALERDPRCGDALAVMGLADLQEKNTKKAVQSLEKALAAGTRFAADCHARIGMVLARKEKSRDRAIEHMEEAKKLSPVAVCGYPARGNIYYQLAKLYEEKGDDERANQQMVELARFQTEDAECRMRIVKHSLRSKKPEVAVKYLEELLFINPFEEDFHKLLARAAEEAGKLDLVIRENKILLGFSGSNPISVHMALAKAFLARGEKKKAVVEARRVLEIDPDHEEAREILRKAGGNPTE
jgi:tetratricopeptide (TPR) repeat protein